MSEVADIITAGATALGVVGPGIAWIVRRTDVRIAKLERDHEDCRGQLAEARQERIENEAKHVTVIELLWQEIERRSRGAPNLVLGRARKLLDDLKEEAKDG